MAQDYDEQLIDATNVRRERLATALLYGPDRLRRRWSDRRTLLVASLFVAVLGCAACVAVSFVINLLAEDPSVQRQRSAEPAALVLASGDPPPLHPAPARAGLVAPAPEAVA